MRKYLISIIFILLMTGSFVLLLAPADTESINAENREVKAMPEFSVKSVWDGTYTASFDEYVNDNIAYRGKLMALSDKIRSYLGYTPNGVGRIIETTSDIGTGEANEGRLVLYNDYIMEMFAANNDAETNYAEALNDIRSALPGDVKMYSMLIPTALEFCDPSYKNAQDSQKEAIEFVNSKLMGVFPVDAYSELEKSDEDYLYFMTDHHWTMDGAYCAYKAFMNMSGGETVNKNDFARKENGNFYGSLYLKAKSQITRQKEDTVFYYDVEENNDIQIKMRAEDNVTEYGVGAPVFRTDLNNYLLFFGGDNPLMEITNNSNPEGKSIVVIKDSYANAFIPWLVASYNKVVVIDPRSFEGSILEETLRYNASEVLVLNYVFSTTFNDYCDMLRDDI